MGPGIDLPLTTLRLAAGPPSAATTGRRRPKRDVAGVACRLGRARPEQSFTSPGALGSRTAPSTTAKPRPWLLSVTRDLRPGVQCVVHEGLLDSCVVGSRWLRFAVGAADLDEGEHDADEVDADADGQDRFPGSRRPQ